MLIRKATPQDVQTLQNLNDEIFVDNSKYDPDLKRDWAQSSVGKEYFNEIVNNPNAICLIAEKNGSEIGYIIAAQIEFSYRLSKYIEIQNMGVITKFRSTGIGSRLMDECLKTAKQNGYQKVYVNSYYNNFGAVNFYETNGFKKIDICLERDL